ncbi:hypothetical protein BCR34DRAFT_589663 [Clohesyomyces aquaticus]|uniref:Uncharacterized protein n=1 Tax=Clohesyomyces aquaticus TaxID=1231657 RepID=A0A1Y1ZF90_9PLEO|nr:hypothetical protein BCR34DRAFT_589663 [Clohesyomyces aquaticus]
MPIAVGQVSDLVKNNNEHHQTIVKDLGIKQQAFLTEGVSQSIKLAQEMNTLSLELKQVAETKDRTIDKLTSELELAKKKLNLHSDREAKMHEVEIEHAKTATKCKALEKEKERLVAEMERKEREMGKRKEKMEKMIAEREERMERSIAEREEKMERRRWRGEDGEEKMERRRWRGEDGEEKMERRRWRGERQRSRVYI